MCNAAYYLAKYFHIIYEKRAAAFQMLQSGDLKLGRTNKTFKATCRALAEV
jgi:hypothetical protein